MVGLFRLGALSQVLLQGTRAPDLPAEFTTSSDLHRELNDTFCPAHTKQFTGSIGLSHGKDLFYWFFESASDPDNDPLLVWLSGGPGAASTFAALTEVGPCWVDATGDSTYHNPYHWAQNANLLVLDQPAGVGFSRASPDVNHQVTTLEQAIEDFVDFMLEFTTRFPHLANKTLHIAAESYGGRWGPAFMNKLYKLNRAQSRRSVANPLGSLILVNAVIGTLGGHLSTSKYEFGCPEDSIAAKLGFGFNDTVCSKIQEIGASCEIFAQTCETTNDLSICARASQYCAEIGAMIDYGNRSPYNVQKPCDDPEYYCSGGLRTSETWFGKKEVAEALGVSDSAWVGTSIKIEQAFAESGALTQSVVPEMLDLLNSESIRVLVFNGDLDFLVTTPGQIRIFDELRWRYQIDYRQEKWKEWTIKGDKGISRGKTKSSHGLKFVTFENAGHMVPADDPVAAARFLTKWLEK